MGQFLLRWIPKLCVICNEAFYPDVKHPWKSCEDCINWFYSEMM